MAAMSAAHLLCLARVSTTRPPPSPALRVRDRCGPAVQFGRARLTAWLRWRLEARMVWRAGAPDRVALVRAATAAQARLEADALHAFRAALHDPAMATRTGGIG